MQTSALRLSAAMFAFCPALCSAITPSVEPVAIVDACLSMNPTTGELSSEGLTVRESVERLVSSNQPYVRSLSATVWRHSDANSTTHEFLGSSPSQEQLNYIRSLLGPTLSSVYPTEYILEQSRAPSACAISISMSISRVAPKLPCKPERAACVITCAKGRCTSAGG